MVDDHELLPCPPSLAIIIVPDRLMLLAPGDKNTEWVGMESRESQAVQKVMNKTPRGITKWEAQWDFHEDFRETRA